MKHSREIIGETIGTFVLVLFGCGSVATTVLFDAHQGLLQIALTWGIGVTLAIYLTRHLSCAHLNPAVTLAMVASKRMSFGKAPSYLLAQFSGAALAGVALYLLYSPSIAAFEVANGITRGSEESIRTGMIFGQYYPNPTSDAVVSMPLAMGAEIFGTFLLVLLIMALTEGCNVGRPDDTMAPVFIGLTVTSIICLLAPLTQACLNPARDFGPRMVAFFAGWGHAAFPADSGGFFFVYLFSPMFGGLAAASVFVFILEPALRLPADPCDCEDVAVQPVSHVHWDERIV